MERNGIFWGISRCKPQMLRASLQAVPASAGSSGTSPRLVSRYYAIRGDDRVQNVILWSLTTILSPLATTSRFTGHHAPATPHTHAEARKGHPLCGTNVSFHKIHFYQYWTGVRF
jgi:hypothetical protein